MRLMHRLLLLGTIALVIAISTVRCEGWSSKNKPTLFGSAYNYKLDSLPKSASLPVQPWSDTYWPSYKSGIAYRWYANTPNNFQYTLNTKEALLKLSSSKMKDLSPAEKYDIYKGRYDYPLVKSEWQRTSPTDASWEGICHGWAPAALAYKQPKSITVTNADGIKIPFGASDLKGLLSYFLAEYSDDFDTLFIGSRCRYDLDANPGQSNSSSCIDLNPGTLHLILTNQIGLMNQGFVVDVDRGVEVWNQPVYGYSFTVGASRNPSAGAARGTTKEVRVDMTMLWTTETSPRWDPRDPRSETSEYSYWLELDSSGKILGGSWITWDRPDFAWSMFVGAFYGYFDSLATLYGSAANVTVSRRSMPEGPASACENFLTEVSGVVATHSDDNSVRFSSGRRHCWVIHPEEAAAQSILIRFQRFSSERLVEKLRIFEYDGETDSKGALVAVHSGSKLPEDVMVKSSGAYLVFETQDEASPSGFRAEYVVAH